MNNLVKNNPDTYMPIVNSPVDNVRNNPTFPERMLNKSTVTTVALIAIMLVGAAFLILWHKYIVPRLYSPKTGTGKSTDVKSLIRGVEIQKLIEEKKISFQNDPILLRKTLTVERDILNDADTINYLKSCSDVESICIKFAGIEWSENSNAITSFLGNYPDLIDINLSQSSVILGDMDIDTIAKQHKKLGSIRLPDHTSDKPAIYTDLALKSLYFNCDGIKMIGYSKHSTMAPGVIEALQSKGIKFSCD